MIKFFGSGMALMAAYIMWGHNGITFTLGLLLANGTIYITYKGEKI